MLLDNYIYTNKSKCSFAIFLYFRRVILSLQNHGRYTRECLIDEFNCRKLNMDEVEHFLEFVFNSGLLQDVTYDIRNIRFDSGLKLKVANTVLTTKYTYDIALYLKSCTDYEPLPAST